LTQLDSYVEADDLGQLYASLAQRLERIVRAEVRTADAVVEDACQFAWGRLADHVGRVRADCALAWLARTAIREARKLVRCQLREPSLELASVQPPRLLLIDELVEQRERLDSIRSLPERQQRILWLAGVGLTYADIALTTGSTERTVERQLLRARRRLRQAA
jgi:RNA polymerase sigma factor (sigma-70 family)